MYIRTRLSCELSSGASHSAAIAARAFVTHVEFPASGGEAMGETAVARLEEGGLSSRGTLEGVDRGC